MGGNDATKKEGGDLEGQRMESDQKDIGTSLPPEWGSLSHLEC